MSQIIPSALDNPEQPMAFFSGPSFAKVALRVLQSSLFFG